MPAPEDLVVIARAVRVGLLGIGAVLVAAGCSSGTDGKATPEGASEQGTAVSATPTLAAEVPSGFDPCTDIPASIIKEEDMRADSPEHGNADYDGSGGRKWRGCGWVVPDSYAVGITTTNLTIDMVEANKDFTVRWDDTIGGRRALATHASDHPRPQERCVLYIEMKGGSLEFSMINPASNKKTGGMDTCDLARGLAEKVVPHVPANA
ncbi:DUF3558 domain-containing protein [Nocardia cyriacigeorgica]|uniref:DUF3558 domain-containing protein n=1 Tax=Nocardia cyriacigeorgica TaxID=135487 RepID=A0A5R8PLB9_9NOCA|nr:DUF3558 domain-containing protein [Nocardia cyriacigeorgica]TLG17947.1 DUF3558 domain-containing protein [Nocardia cyriacigeorgica]